MPSLLTTHHCTPSPGRPLTATYIPTWGGHLRRPARCLVASLQVASLHVASRQLQGLRASCKGSARQLQGLRASCKGSAPLRRLRRIVRVAAAAAATPPPRGGYSSQYRAPSSQVFVTTLHALERARASSSPPSSPCFSAPPSGRDTAGLHTPHLTQPLI